MGGDRIQNQLMTSTRSSAHNSCLAAAPGVSGQVGCCWTGRGGGSVAENQVDLLAVEEVAAALGHGSPRRLLVGEGDQGLAAALAAEVVQDENGVGLQLQEKKKHHCLRAAGGAGSVSEEGKSTCKERDADTKQDMEGPRRPIAAAGSDPRTGS